jgi:hypothetical protein
LLPFTGTLAYDTSLVSYRRSTKDCLVSYQGNYYSVPAASAQQQLLLKENEQGELLIFTLDGQPLAQHRLAVTHQQRIIIASHYAGITTFGIAPPAPEKAKQQPSLLPAPLALDAPIVEVRPLQIYEQWLEAGA